MSALPTELWQLIASSLRKPDQAHLGTTSSRLLHIVRPLLYHTVEVNFWYGPGPHKVLVLLAQDKSLAKLVVELTLKNWNSLPHIDFNAIAYMVSLRRVTISRNIFGTAARQNEFGKALSIRSGVSLEDLTWFGAEYSLPGAEFQGIGNLKTLVWTDGGTSTTSSRAMWDILSRSQTTIRTLCLSFKSLEHIPSQLRNVRFPHLRSLTMDFRYGVTNAGVSTDHAGFILGYSDNLDELGLDHDVVKTGWGVDFYNAFSRGLKPSSFPRLRSYRGDLKTFELMVQERLECLGSTLQRLELRPITKSKSSCRSELCRVCDVIVASGCHFSVLKEIKLDMTSMRPRDINMVVSLIRKFATICGRSLEVWNGTFPRFRMGANVIVDLFAPFEKLRRLRLVVDNIDPKPDEDVDSALKANLKTIASKCLSLEEIVEDNGPANFPFHWTITRAHTAKHERLVFAVHRPGMY